MSKLKATKNLIRAVIALVASLVLCIGVCLAWYAQNGKVWGDGLNSNIKSTNITQFDVEAYTLSDKVTQTVDGTSVTTFTVVDKIEGDNPVKQMTAYGGMVDVKVTALLLKFTFTFDDTLNKNYAIYANCTDTRSPITGDGTLLECALSSVISFYGMNSGETEESTTVTQKAEIKGEAVPDTNRSLITLKDGISDSQKSGTFYCIVDYVEDKIFTQYYKALTINGTTFSTPMDFSSDIEFYIGESSAA